jgi:hypothetical protein
MFRSHMDSSITIFCQISESNFFVSNVNCFFCIFSSISLYLLPFLFLFLYLYLLRLIQECLILYLARSCFPIDMTACMRDLLFAICSVVLYVCFGGAGWAMVCVYHRSEKRR